MLYKRGKKEGAKFNKRRFILSQVDCTLKYFVKDVSYLSSAARAAKRSDRTLQAVPDRNSD